MSRALLTLTFALICIFHVSGQTTEKQLRDSLASPQKDETKIKLLIKLSWRVVKRNPDSAMMLVQRAMTIAQLTESPKDLARAYSAVADIYYVQGKYASAIENYKTSFIHAQK